MVRSNKIQHRWPKYQRCEGVRPVFFGAKMNENCNFASFHVDFFRRDTFFPLFFTPKSGLRRPQDPRPKTQPSGWLQDPRPSRPGRPKTQDPRPVPRVKAFLTREENFCVALVRKDPARCKAPGGFFRAVLGEKATPFHGERGLSGPVTDV